MPILIGITQEPEETLQHFARKYKEARETMAIVGPFPSAEKASNWVEFIKAQTDDYEHVLNPSPFLRDMPWYGFTFECLKSKEISLHIPL